MADGKGQQRTYLEGIKEKECFRCCRCQITAKQPQHIIDHCVRDHPLQTLKLDIECLEPSSGKIGILTKDYEIVPYDILGIDETFNVDDESFDLCITKSVDALEESVLNLSLDPESPLAKKLKCSTPSSAHYSRIKGEDDPNIQSFMESVPVVLEELKRVGHLQTWLDLNKMIAEKDFPLDNIAFLLFMDVSKFLALRNSSSMRYSDKVKQFWRVGYRLFHGKWLRFMGGPKHAGQLVSEQCAKGEFDPTDGEINFAVPHRAVVSSDLSPVSSSEVSPGILHGLLSKLAEKSDTVNKTFKICVDGKKINSSFTTKHGDIDLWGHESKPTLKERKEQLHVELKKIEDAMDYVLNKIQQSKDNICDLRVDQKECIREMLQKNITLLSLRIKALRETLLQEERNRDRLIKSTDGGDWRKSKLVFVISGLITHLYELKSCIHNLLRDVDELCKIIANINGARFLSSGVLNMNTNRQHINLGSTSVDLTDSEQFRFVEQRSEAWFDIRQTAKVTGSTLFDAIGLGTFKCQLEHYDNVTFQKPKPEPSASIKKKMVHGTENEINASATFSGKFLPVFHRELDFFDEGCYKILTSNDVCIVISPDGSCRQSVMEPAAFGVECKCPFPGNLFSTPVHYSIPKYYVPQILSEMHCLHVNQLYFVSYSQESTTVQLATFDADLWDSLEKEIADVYHHSSHRPTKKSSSCGDISMKISKFMSSNVELVAEVLSIQGSYSEGHSAADSNHFTGGKLSLDTIVATLTNARNNVEKAYNLTRRKASELLGFMISDLDREFSFEQLHSVPIAYGLKGYSLPTSTIRDMIETVLKACSSQGMYTPICSFDGQWAKLVLRSKDDQPLTVLQLQKDVFDKVKRMSKAELLKLIFTRNEVDLDKNCTYEDLKSIVRITKVDGNGHAITVSSCSTEKPFVTSRQSHAMLKENKLEIEPTEISSDNIGNGIAPSLPSEVMSQIDDNILSQIDAIQIQVEPYRQTKEHVQDLSKVFDDEVVLANPEDLELQILTAADPETKLLAEHDIQNMLEALRGDEKANKKGKWEISKEEFLQKMNSASEISKLLAYDLKVCLRPVIGKLKSAGFKINMSGSKRSHINILSQVVGDKSEMPLADCPKVKKVKNVGSLKGLCKDVIRQIPKAHLNVLVSENIFPGELERWYLKSPFGKTIALEGIDCSRFKQWFSYPEMNESVGYYVFMILDAYHQLCGLRRLFSSSGIPAAGVSYKPLHKVAEDSASNGSGLNTALVKDLIDKQSVAYAVQTFSENVEKALLDIGAVEEAKFCSLVRNWYIAEDEPGISAIQRCLYRLEFREWLLLHVNFGIFPPSGAYVKDIPKVLYEGLITGIERRLQMFPFVKSGSYNVRCIGSLDIENFFGSFQDYDPWGTGVLRPDSIPTAISVATELLEARLDPERVFHMCTSSAKVYPCNTYQTQMEYATTGMSVTIRDLSRIPIQDHGFDKKSRARGRRKRKKGDVSKPDEPARKPLTVREFHRAHDAKILPHVRRGLNLDDCE